VDELHVVIRFYFGNNAHVSDLPLLFSCGKKNQIAWLELSDFFNFFTLKCLGIGRSWKQNIDGFVGVTGESGAIHACPRSTAIFIRSARVAAGCFDYCGDLIFDFGLSGGSATGC
jgi:hypothetical protein